MSRTIYPDSMLFDMHGLSHVPQIIIKNASDINLSIMCIRDFDICDESPNVEMDFLVHKDGSTTMWTTHLGPCVGILLRAVNTRGDLIAHSLMHDSEFSLMTLDDRIQRIDEMIEEFQQWMMENRLDDYTHFELCIAGGQRNGKEKHEDVDQEIKIITEEFPECKLVFYNTQINYAYPVAHRTSIDPMDDYTSTTLVSHANGNVYVLVIDPFAIGH